MCGTLICLQFSPGTCTVKRKMPRFQEATELVLYAISKSMVLDEEFASLYDTNTSKNRDFEYLIWDAFNLHEISDDDCVVEFRFQKNDMPRLVTALQLPDEKDTVWHVQWFKSSMVEALCVILKRLAFPCRYSDMMPRFARPVPQLTMISNETIHWLDSRWGLTDLNQRWLTPQNHMSFANWNYQKGTALDNVWGFVDGTVEV